MSDYDPDHPRHGLWLVILAIALASTLVIGLLVLAEKF